MGLIQAPSVSVKRIVHRQTETNTCWLYDLLHALEMADGRTSTLTESSAVALSCIHVCLERCKTARPGVCPPTYIFTQEKECLLLS